MPTSDDPIYNERSLPPYLAALQSSGAIPVVLPLNEGQDRIAKILAGVQGIVLPGSLHDVDPQRYGEAPIPECGEADSARAAADELMLHDAFNLRKPILAICHGTQTLNVWRSGSLVQDLQTPVNHSPGREVVEAHPVTITPGSRLSALLPVGEPSVAQVNSSHHQAIRVPGDNLLVSAVSPADGVIEGVELDSPDHFVVAVQWHPERTYTQSAFSRAIFAAFLREANDWEIRQIEPAVANHE